MHIRRAPSPPSSCLFLSAFHPSELGILTWESPPRVIFIPRFGGWYPLFSFTLDGRYPQGVTKSAWQHNGRVSTRRPLARALSSPGSPTSRTYDGMTIRTRICRSKFHPRNRSITFVLSDKSLAPVRVNSRWYRARKRRGLSVYLETAHCVSETVHFLL